MSTIYVLMNDGRQEASDEGHVRDLLHRGLLTRENFFWMEGMSDWRPLREHPVLGPAAVPLGPPTTAPVRFSNDGDDDLAYKFRFMHKVRFLRMVAASIDLLLVLAPAIFVFFFGWFVPDADTNETAPFLFCVGVYYIALIIMQVVLSFLGRSVGKNFFGLRFVDIDTLEKRGFVGNAIRLATHGFFWLIPLCLFTRMPPDVTDGVILYAIIDALVIFYDDRCIHDYLAGTSVIQREIY
jgi:uncharacterized RDD family membrane protein YckC